MAEFEKLVHDFDEPTQLYASLYGKANQNQPFLQRNLLRRINRRIESLQTKNKSEHDLQRKELVLSLQWRSSHLNMRLLSCYFLVHNNETIKHFAQHFDKTQVSDRFDISEVLVKEKIHKLLQASSKGTSSSNPVSVVVLVTTADNTYSVGLNDAEMIVKHNKWFKQLQDLYIKYENRKKQYKFLDFNSDEEIVEINFPTNVAMVQFENIHKLLASSNSSKKANAKKKQLGKSFIRPLTNPFDAFALPLRIHSEQVLQSNTNSNNQTNSSDSSALSNSDHKSSKTSTDSRSLHFSRKLTSLLRRNEVDVNGIELKFLAFTQMESEETVAEPMAVTESTAEEQVGVFDASEDYFFESNDEVIDNSSQHLLDGRKEETVTFSLHGLRVKYFFLSAGAEKHQLIALQEEGFAKEKLDVHCPFCARHFSTASMNASTNTLMTATDSKLFDEHYRQTIGLLAEKLLLHFEAMHGQVKITHFQLSSDFNVNSDSNESPRRKSCEYTLHVLLAREQCSAAEEVHGNALSSGKFFSLFRRKVKFRNSQKRKAQISEDSAQIVKSKRRARSATAGEQILKEKVDLSAERESLCEVSAQAMRSYYRQLMFEENNNSAQMHAVESAVSATTTVSTARSRERPAITAESKRLLKQLRLVRSHNNQSLSVHWNDQRVDFHDSDDEFPAIQCDNQVNIAKLREIDEFLDLHAAEKQFMRLWSEHLLTFPCYSDRLLFLVCERFAGKHAGDLLRMNLRYCFLLHLLTLYDFGLLCAEETQYLLRIVDSHCK